MGKSRKVTQLLLLLSEKPFLRKIASYYYLVGIRLLIAGNTLFAAAVIVVVIVIGAVADAVALASLIATRLYLTWRFTCAHSGHASAAFTCLTSDDGHSDIAT